jgi:hypothetical protein
MWPLAGGPFAEAPRQALSYQPGDARREYADGLLRFADRPSLAEAGLDGVRLDEWPLMSLRDTAAANEPGRPTAAVDAVTIARRTYNTAVVEVETASETDLIWRNSDFPGWSATVRRLDGEFSATRGAVTRASDLFMAVRVPAGRAEVTFRFNPAGFRVLFWWTYLSLAALAGVTAVRRTRARPATVAVVA